MIRPARTGNLYSLGLGFIRQLCTDLHERANSISDRGVEAVMWCDPHPRGEDQTLDV